MDELDAWAAYDHTALVAAIKEEFWMVKSDSIGEWVCIPRVGDVDVPALLRAVADLWEESNGEKRLAR